MKSLLFLSEHTTLSSCTNCALLLSIKVGWTANERTPQAPSASAQRAPHAWVFAACNEPGVSLAGVALAFGLNGNLVRQWRRGRGLKPAGGAVMAATSVTREAQQQFIALAIPQAVPVSATPTDTNAGAGDDIRIEVHRGALQISGSWPQAAAADCAGWLRELLKRSAWTQFGWPPNPLTCARAPTAYWLRWCRFSALRRRTTTTCSPTRAARSSSCGCTTASASGAPRGARTRGRNQGRIQWPAAGSWDSLTLSVIAG